MAHPASANLTSAKPQVLICDDDPIFSSELSETLRSRGYGAAALLSLSAIRAAIVGPSVLLLDICMPEPDGFEIMRMLSRHERRDHFKIILISGWQDAMLDTAARLCDAQGLCLLGAFRKPITIRDLCELLDDCAWN